MGFFDNYKDEGGVDYFSEEEKLVVIKEALPLTLVRGWYTENGGYQGKPAYKLIVEYEGKERGLSFGLTSVPSRDEMISAMLEYMDVDEDAKSEDWEAPRFVIYKVGQAQLLKAAE